MKKWVTHSGYTILRVLSGRSNVFLITNEKNNILVDTNTKKNRKRLKKALSALNCSHIPLLVLTHTHFDHTANAAAIQMDYHASILVHCAEADFLAAGNTPLPQGTNVFTRFFIQHIAKMNSPVVQYEGIKSDITVTDNYDLQDYGLKAFILHTPGHSSGSVSIIVDDEIAIVGDAMFGVFKNSVFPPFADDPLLMVESWGKLLNTGCKTFLPSHGTEKGAELLKREYLKYRKKYV